MPRHSKSADRLQTPPQRPDGLEEEPRGPIARRPQDVSDPRAKASGHRKKTADKWNQ